MSESPIQKVFGDKSSLIPALLEDILEHVSQLNGVKKEALQNLKELKDKAVDKLETLEGAGLSDFVIGVMDVTWLIEEPLVEVRKGVAWCF